MAELSIEDVEKIATLARLHLTAEELEMYQGKLTAVLGYVAQLDELDLGGVSPTAHAVFQQNVVRKDVINSVLPNDEALANAAAKMDGQFAIQAVLDE